MSFDFSKFRNAAAPTAQTITMPTGSATPVAAAPAAPSAPATLPAVGPAPVTINPNRENPFANADKEDINSFAPRPLPRGVKRDPNAPPDSNMIEWHPAFYVIGIEKVLYKKVNGQNGKKQILTEISGIVLSSTGDTPVGSEVAIAIFEGTYSNKMCKMFAASVLNVHHTTQLAPQMGAMVDPDLNPFKGLTFGVHVDNEKGKERWAGRDFERYRFVPAGVVGEQDGQPVFGAIDNKTGL